MDHATAYRKLLYEHEVLWARYEIRDHHLKKIGEKIYDDIGQVLSLVRIQLCRAGFAPETATQPGELVGDAIRGLRAMHRSFYPETGLRETGLHTALAHELELSGIGLNQNGVTVQGTPHDLAAGTQLIVLRMMQEILSAIPPSGNANDVTIHVAYYESAVCFTIGYSGGPPKWGRSLNGTSAEATRLSLAERAALIESNLSVQSNEAGKTQITLTVPFKTSVYGP